MKAIRFDLAPLAVGSAPAAGLTDALSSAAGYALNEKADATRRAYRSDLRHFAAWCETVQAVALPAQPATVAGYLASMADSGLKASSIMRRAAAIAYAHKLGGFESPINENVKAIMRGIRRKLGTARKGKAPATAAVVAKLTRKMPDTLVGKRDRALILIGFAAALRRSELVALNVGDVERNDSGVFLHIRRSKTDQEGAGALIAVPDGKKLKPVEALDAWLTAAGIRNGALFRGIDKAGGLGERLTGQSVALIVKRWAKTARVRSDSVFRTLAALGLRHQRARGRRRRVQGDGRHAPPGGRDLAGIRPARQVVQGSRGEGLPMSGHAPTADEDLRVIALAAALECEGPKALTGEVLAAAEEIYRFLKGQRDDDAGSGTAH